MSTAAKMSHNFSLILFYPLNSATSAAGRVNAPAARVTIKSRAPAVGRKCNRLGPVFCYQYGRFFGLVIIDQITLGKGFPSGGTVARISSDNLHHCTSKTVFNNLVTLSASNADASGFSSSSKARSHPKRSAAYCANSSNIWLLINNPIF